ncbi:ABC transporter ATP-binding protein [Anaerobacillus sp. CMMVII]|nr:ABC transporter ATP-binding protein [Anaerobacillus sp. CMMVII]
MNIIAINRWNIKNKSGSRFLLNKKYESWSEREMRKEMGFVFQNPEHQFITDTVYDEVGFGMVLNKTPENLLKEKVNQLLERFHLVNHKWSNPFSLSGGQKRRLSVATMLDEVPSVLLFDEPTFGQDAETTEELMEMIESLRKKGTAIVFVTHDMDLVDSFCQRVYVVNQGKLSFQGTPEELWEKKELLVESHLRLPYRVRMEERLPKENKSGVEFIHDYVY